MSKRAVYKLASGPLTWANAIAWAEKGQPELLGLMVSDLVPPEHKGAVQRLVMKPPPRARVPRYLPDDVVRLIRLKNARLEAAGYQEKGRLPILQAEIKTEDGKPIAIETLRDVGSVTATATAKESRREREGGEN